MILSTPFTAATAAAAAAAAVAAAAHPRAASGRLTTPKLLFPFSVADPQDESQRGYLQQWAPAIQETFC